MSEPAFLVAIDWRGRDGNRRDPVTTFAPVPLVIACDICRRTVSCYLDTDDNHYREGEGRIVHSYILCRDRENCGPFRSIVWMPYYQHTSGTWMGLERKERAA